MAYREQNVVVEMMFDLSVGTICDCHGRLIARDTIFSQVASPAVSASKSRLGHLRALGPGSSKPNRGLSLNFPASLFTEYETDSLPKRLHCNVENQMNSPGFLRLNSSSLLTNSTNPGVG